MHAADEADVLGLGLLGGRDADEVGALVGGEDQVGDVLQRAFGIVVEAVDDREVDVRVLGRDLRRRRQ